MPAARELGVGIVPYSPLGRGELAGHARHRRPRTTSARYLPRFQEEQPRAQPRSCRRGCAEIADEVGCTPVQLALAWLLHQGDDVVPIPGTKRVEVPRGERRGGGRGAHGRAARRRSTRPCRRGAVAGERYPAEGMATVERSRLGARARTRTGEALGAGRLEDLVAVLRAAGLEHELDRRLARRGGRARRAGAPRPRRSRRARPRSPAGSPGRRAGPEPLSRARPGAAPPSRRGGCTRTGARRPRCRPRGPRTRARPPRAPSTRPCISAATATAPAPSTTSFERSRSSTIASATSSSVTVTTSST